VPKKYKDDQKLGNWVATQRACFKNGTMDQEQKARLEEIGFEFSYMEKMNEDIWNSKFQKLRAFKANHGHCELLWAVYRFTFVLNTPTNTPRVSLLALQVKCHKGTRKTKNWAYGS
jgi:hypothetical protein